MNVRKAKAWLDLYAGLYPDFHCLCISDRAGCD